MSSSSSNSNSKESKGKDDFIRQYAAEIAKALQDRESDNGRPSSSSRTSMDDMIYELYRSLCFDEPIIDESIIINFPVVVSALCRKLLLSTTTTTTTGNDEDVNVINYALSNRFVNGIIHICQQQNQQQNQVNDNNNTATANNNKKKVFATSMAKLAFCVLIQIPLECCQQLLLLLLNNNIPSSQKDLTVVQKYLGSYKGSCNNNDQKHKQQQQQQQQQVDQFPSKNNEEEEEEEMKEEENHQVVADDNNNNNNNNNDNNDNDSLQEVWATESDPSDYDYNGEEGEGEGEGEEGETAAAKPQLTVSKEEVEEEEEDCWFDPKFLSKSNPTLSIDDVMNAILSLLQYVNFSLLGEPLFLLLQSSTTTKKKKDLDLYIMQLTQLILLLFQPSSPFLNMNMNNNNNNNNNNNITSQQHSADALFSPLWLLRDAAILTTSTSTTTKANNNNTNNTIFISSYLDVLQTLLAMDQAHIMQDNNGGVGAVPFINRKSSTTTEPLCIASIVGLSALSSWCSSCMEEENTTNNNKNQFLLTIKAISESMNELAHVVERASSSDNDDDNDNANDDQQQKRQQQLYNLTHTLVPILDFMTGITYNYVVLQQQQQPSSSSSSSLSPQILLNSGLIRQLLSIAMMGISVGVGSNGREKENEAGHGPITTTTTSHQQHDHNNYYYNYYFDHAIWGLCVTYPTTIGKYAIRYPGFGMIVRRYNSKSNNTNNGQQPKQKQAEATDCVQSILWNLFAFQQCCDNNNSNNNNKNDTPRVIWKSTSSKNSKKGGNSSSKSVPSSSPPPLTREECEEVCQKSWSKLCGLVSDAIKECIEKPHDSMKVIQEWQRLRTLISGVPYVRSVVDSLSTTLLDRTVMDDVVTVVLMGFERKYPQKEMKEKKKKQHPKSVNDDKKSSSDVEENNNDDDDDDVLRPPKTIDDDDDDDGNKNNKKVVDHHVVTAEIRKTLKQYTLLFEGTSTIGNSKTD